MSERVTHTRHGILSRTIVAAALALGAAAVTACQREGRTGDEAPSRSAAAPSRTETSGGEVSNTLPGMTSERAAYDTVPKRGIAGSGTAAVGNPHGKPNAPGTDRLRSGDPTDAAVAAALALVHAQEVEAARLAAGKAQSPQARAYAQAMLAAHQGPARQGAAATSGDEPQSASDLLVPAREQHAKYVALLTRTPAGPAFDRAYLSSQVESHRAASQLMTRLETATTDRALLARIQQMEAAVATHRHQAEEALATVQSLEARAAAGVAGATVGPIPPGSPTPTARP